MQKLGNPQITMARSEKSYASSFMLHLRVDPHLSRFLTFSVISGGSPSPIHENHDLNGDNCYNVVKTMS